MKHHRRAEPVIKDLFKERISVSLFAGCGGACVGMRAATGNEVDVAINHDKVAIAVHRQNHPTTEHRISDVFEVKPQSATRGRRVGHLHASPDCRHFSRAAGAAPKSDSVRSLADVVIDWARLPEDDGAHPDVITLENVCEFVEWGPLYGERTWRRRAAAEVFTGDACPECEWQPTYTAKGKLVKAPERHRACAWRYVTGQPIPARRGEFFRRWVGDLEALGYIVEWRVLAAHHYGAHTSRRRLYLVARCDGQPIVWPAPTHGPGLKKYRTAAECIDWSLLARSIFNRAKPLAAATLRRIAAGIVKFCLGKDPYIITLRRTAPPEFFEQYPNARHVYPFLISYYGSEADIGQALGEPLRTITTRDRFGLVTLVLDREGRALVDIGLRMLEPHELLKAQFGKHAKRFRLDKALTKKDQVRLIGNSVVPAVMEAIVRANLGEAKPTRRAA